MLNHNDMKAYGGVAEVQLKKVAHCTVNLVGRKPVLDSLEKRKASASAGNRIPAFQSVA
jgi:hypothetical protein